MVMSYRGARAEADPKERMQNIQIREHMTPLSKLITFKADQKVEEVMSTLINKKISGGPVVDESGQLVGLISEGDCLKEVVRGKYYNTPKDSGSVADHMAINVITVDPEKDIFCIDACI